MVTWFFKNGYKIGFDKVLDMFQPYVTDGTSRQSILLLLEEDQIYKAEDILKKIDATKMNFDFFTTVATGGFRLSMKGNYLNNQPFRDPPGYRIN
jgi:hypothetical protein